MNLYTCLGVEVEFSTYFHKFPPRPIFWLRRPDLQLHGVAGNCSKLQVVAFRCALDLIQSRPKKQATQAIPAYLNLKYNKDFP